MCVCDWFERFSRNLRQKKKGETASDVSLDSFTGISVRELISI